MYLLLFLCILVPLGKSDKYLLKTTVDLPNYFDKGLITISKSSAFDNLYGFSEDKACMLRKDIKDGWIVSIQRINSMERSGPIKIETYNDYRYLMPINCFYFKEHSYIIFKNIRTNETSIIRGFHEKVIGNLLFDQIEYDHISKKLYLIRDNKIFEVNINAMELWWLDKNQDESVSLRTEYVGTIPEKYTDFLIIDNQIYLINNRKIYRNKLGDVENGEFIKNSNADVFNFMIFKEYEQILISKSNFWLYFLYVFDMIMLIICAFIIKTIKIKRKKDQYPPIVMQAMTSDLEDERVYKG